MKADHILRTICHRCEFNDGETGRGRRKDRSRTAYLVESDEEGGLDIDVLNNRFNDKINVREILQCG